MPLNSRTFAGDPALEACLVNDSAHLTIGVQGEHVAKVQSAIIFLDGLDIDPAELRAQLYGESTAAAVLRFKTARGIINRAYQQTPDKIVGKMTIKALDDELVLAENAPVRVAPLQMCPRPN
jgi:peptidoglycan hydrolase-like protein with peptidoglycan-binding domain